MVLYIFNVFSLENCPKMSFCVVALTGGKIVTDVGPKFTGGLPHHIEQNLGSRVWGYSGPSGPKKQVSDDSDVFVGANTGEVSKSLLE